MKRYFIVFYETVEEGNGCKEYILNKYPNALDTVMDISSIYEIPTPNVSITNIIELTEQDYLDWVK